jgi:hypothetical protein
MREAIPPLLQYAFMAWCSVKAQGQIYLYLYLFVVCDDVCAFMCRLLQPEKGQQFSAEV